MADVDVFAENYTIIDWEVHELWIRGLSVTEAVVVMRERGILKEYPGITLDLLVSDLNDHYRLFAMLESVLLNVGNFSEQMLYQMSPETQEIFIEKYYGLDTVFCREILGRKLSSRLRKDLDEVAEKTGVQLKSCRRQFDNIKRIFKAVEEKLGNFVDNIEKMFKLPRLLSEHYAVIVFVGTFRFEMTKKKLNTLSFESIMSVCLCLMSSWMSKSGGSEPSLDRDFLSSLKELKVLLERDKEHRNVVCSKIQGSLTPKCYSEVEANFKMISRNLLTLGTSLSSSKDGRDFFVHLMEKIVDPLKQMQLDKADMELFLKMYLEAVTTNVIQVEEQIVKALQRFMETLTQCVLLVY